MSSLLKVVIKQPFVIPIISAISPTFVVTIGQLHAIASLIICGDPSENEVNNKKSTAFNSKATSSLVLFFDKTVHPQSRIHS